MTTVVLKVNQFDKDRIEMWNTLGALVGVFYVDDLFATKDSDEMVKKLLHDGEMKCKLYEA